MVQYTNLYYYKKPYFPLAIGLKKNRDLEIICNNSNRNCWKFIGIFFLSFVCLFLKDKTLEKIPFCNHL